MLQVSMVLQFFDIEAPKVQEKNNLELLSENHVPDIKLLSLISEDDFELMTEQWLFSMKNKYKYVKRIGGSGDQGRDIFAYQCKEGFIRNKPNKIDIEIVGNKEYRYKNNKFHEIITYKTDSLEENSIEATEKFYYDKNGNLKKIIKRNIFGEITNNKNK